MKLTLIVALVTLGWVAHVSAAPAPSFDFDAIEKRFFSSFQSSIDNVRDKMAALRDKLNNKFAGIRDRLQDIADKTAAVGTSIRDNATVIDFGDGCLAYAKEPSSISISCNSNGQTVPEGALDFSGMLPNECRTHTIGSTVLTVCVKNGGCKEIRFGGSTSTVCMSSSSSSSSSGLTVIG